MRVMHPELSSGRKLDFMIIGMQKSGTTALDSYLRFHPAIGLPPHKMIDFFNNKRLFRLPARLREIYYHNHFPDYKNPDKLLGETPYYITEPLFLDRMHTYNSRLKLIVILRDPVSRAYSHWNMQRERGLEHRSFEQAVLESMDQLKSGLKPEPRFNYVQLGQYATTLKYLTTLFPREQVLVLFQQDLRTNPLDTMNRITQFLGVSPFKRLTAKEVHRREYPEPMSDSIKKELKAHYLPHIEELEEFLGIDLSKWK